jgi:purine-binding chemotaxis protein CheW
MSNGLDATLASERKILTFTIRGQLFGIDMAPLVEVREWEAPTPLPGAPAFVRGISTLRGMPVPIVDLAERLGWPGTALHARSCVVIVSIGGEQVGFLVDEVADIFPIDAEAVKACPDVAMAERESVSGLVELPGAGTVILLDLDPLRVVAPADLAA